MILSNDRDRDRWSQVGPAVGHGAANLGVIASTAAFTAGGPWLDDVIEYLERNRRTLAELVHDLLPGVGCTPPEGTYLAWLDVRDLGLGAQPAAFA